jgi:hypothetical protein
MRIFVTTRKIGSSSKTFGAAFGLAFGLQQQECSIRTPLRQFFYLHPF